MEINNNLESLFFVKRFSRTENFAAGNKTWLEIPISIPSDYEVVSIHANADKPGSIMLTGMFAMSTSKVAVAYNCLAGGTYTVDIRIIAMNKGSYITN